MSRLSDRIRQLFYQTENSLAFVTIFLLGLFPSLEALARKLFHTGVPNSTEYSHQLVLILTFLGGIITSREGKHLSLSLDLKLAGPIKSRIDVLVAILASMMTTAFAWSALSFSLTGFDHAEKIGPFPVWLISLVMSAGYAVMALRFVSHLPRHTWGRRLAVIGLLLGTWLALDPLNNILVFLFNRTPAFLAPLLAFYHSANVALALPLIGVLIASAIFGTPIFVILGGVAYLLFARTGQPLEIMPNEAYTLLIDHALPAIPLFAFTGFVLSESKAGERLVKLFKSLFAWFPGGLAVMAILVCTFFTTFTGASGVTILALGGLLSLVLIRGHFNKKFTSGLLTAVGSIGLLFPPSLPIIIYGVTAQVNIKHLFLGGIIPGTLMVLTMIGFGIIHARRHRVERETFNLREALQAVKESIWEIMLPVIILLGYFGGLTTLVESAAIAVIYSLFIEMVIHRDIRIRDLPGVMLKCMPVIGGVLTILALAKGLSYYIVDAEIPMQLTAWIQAHIHSKYVFLLLLNLALIITGCFLDIFSAILVVVPLILPLGELFGIQPVHLGIIFLANLELGYLTPPVGLNLYLASYRFNEPIAKIYRDVLPFLLIQLLAVLLITYLPFLSTALLPR